ncbi:hypothetical protein [Pseudomonas psychrophila]|uniref:hypothetical protein n=1 Tax=Pseudomonas psychrophila TaxID=122355 RepID=UPI0037F97387
MAVPEGPTDKRYIGNGVTKTFTIPFLLLAATDLDVFIDGIEVISGFTVTSVGYPTSTLTFAVAPADQAEIYLQLDVPFERLNDYQENGDFLSSTVNRDFDRIWQALKQLLRWAGRSLRLGYFDVDGRGWYRANGNGIRDLHDPVNSQDAVTKKYADDLTLDTTQYTDTQMLRTVRAANGETLNQLPSASARSNKVMGFDAAGNPIGVLPASGSGTELAIDLASSAKGKGASMMAWLRKPLSARMDDVQSRLDALHVSPWEKIDLVIKPNLNDPSTWDWTVALQATIDEAFANVGVAQMYSANINHCQVVIDGGGYGYQTTSRLQIPDGGGVTFLNGLTYAHNTFTASSLVRMGNSESTGAFRHENVKWDKWIFDSRHKTGGVLVTNSIRCKFIDCSFLRYLTDGARTFGNCVEIHFIGCDFGTKPYKNSNPVMGDAPEVAGSQVGLRLGSTDNKVIRCIFHRGKSIVIQAQAQHISQCQFYGSDPWGVSIEVRSSGSTINDNAFGKFGIAVYSPFNTSITCNMFVMEDTLDTDWGISLIPVSAGENMAGYSQHGNTFRKVGTGPRPKSTNYDTTYGTIARVRSSKIRDNFHYGVRETCTTQATMTQTLAVTSRHTFDFSALIEFGVPAKVNVEFIQNSGAPANVGAATDGNLAQISRTSVPVRLDSAANGSLQVFLSVEEGIAPL